MTSSRITSRRDFLALLSSLPAIGLVPADAVGQRQMPSRPIPSSKELLPIVGLGSSKVVDETAKHGLVRQLT